MPGSKSRPSIRFLTSITAQNSGTWIHTGTLNFPRIGHTAILLGNGQVLVAGGEDAQSKPIATARTLQPVHRSVDRYRQSATPRIDHTATLRANGEVRVAGGVSSTYTATAELYNPLTGQWTATGSMTVPRPFAAAALLHNGQVLIAGGSNRNGPQT